MLNFLFPHKEPEGALYEFDAEGKTWLDRISDNGQIERLIVNKITTR